MSLADRFGRRHTYLRLGLTERCNLRCVYCMPAEGLAVAPKATYLTTDEAVRLARVLVGAGVEKVRLTGGEPLVRKDAVAVAAQVGALPGLRSLAITTNGLLLEDRLADLDRAGLTDLTVSLDTLREDRFREVTRRPGLGRVLSAIDAALARGYGTDGRTLKINVVALRGVNEDEAVDFAAWAAREPVEVRFIEVMPFAGNGWDRAELVPYAETRARIEDAHGPLRPLSDGPHATAVTFDRPGWRGRVGFVASMTAPFCAGCNRLRVLADGALKVCLFGRAEVSLRDAMRAGASDGDLLRLVRQSLGGKHAAHAGLDALAAATGRTMTEGGRGVGGWEDGRMGGWEDGRMGGWEGGRGKVPGTLRPSRWRRQSRPGCFPHSALRTPHSDRRGIPNGPSGSAGPGILAASPTATMTETPSLSHVDDQGQARMVDVSHKPDSARTAVAAGRVVVGAEALRLIRENEIQKGDVLTVSNVAGVLGAKQTSRLLPLCHDVNLQNVEIEFDLDDDAGAVHIRAITKTVGPTGVEMEALTAVSVAALTVYDMCKSVTKSIEITDVRLLAKTGGRSGDYRRSARNN